MKLLLVLGLVVLLADGGSALAQQDGGGPGGGRRGGRGFPGGGGPGGGFPGGGRKGGRGMNFDPAQIFDQFAGGKAVISRDDIDPNNRMALGMFDRVTQTLNITNNQITRDQFVTGFEQMRQNFGGRGGPGGPGGGQGPGGRGQNLDDMADAQFKQLDKNNDGFLNTDEMPASLRSELARYDTNRDNLIDLQEFKAYLRDQGRQGGMNQAAMYELANIPEPEEEKRPVVYNAKNYPKELPAWFKQLDVDSDGQVALYEWRRGGRPLEEFMAMDRNDDGFLTVEEVLYAVARTSSKNGDVQTASYSPGEGQGMNNGGPGFGRGQQGFGPGGFGPGGFGKGKGQFGKGGNGQFRGPGGGAGGPGGGDQAQIGGRRGRGGFGPGGGGDNGNGDNTRGKKGGGRRGGNGGGQGGNGYGG